jgi:hypothetical protein
VLLAGSPAIRACISARSIAWSPGRKANDKLDRIAFVDTGFLIGHKAANPKHRAVSFC